MSTPESIFHLSIDGNFTEVDGDVMPGRDGVNKDIIPDGSSECNASFDENGVFLGEIPPEFEITPAARIAFSHAGEDPFIEIPEPQPTIIQTPAKLATVTGIGFHSPRLTEWTAEVSDDNRQLYR